MQEAKVFYQLAISYGTKYAQYDLVSFALGNLMAEQYKHLPAEIADLTSRTATVMNEFDFVKSKIANYRFFYHIGAAYYQKQYSYCESLIDNKLAGIYDKDSRNWLQLEFAKAGIFKSKKMYTEAFFIYEKYFQHSCEGIIDQRLYHFIVKEIKELYDHLDEIDAPMQAVKRIFDGYMQHSIQLQQFFMSQPDKEPMFDTNIQGLETKDIFIEKANKALVKGQRATFVCFDFVTGKTNSRSLLKTFSYVLAHMMSTFNEKIMSATVLDEAMLGVIIKETEEVVDQSLQPVFDQLRQHVKTDGTDVVKIRYISIGNEEYELYNYEACLNLIHARIYYELCRMV